MAIHFSAQRRAEIQNTYEAWWQGKLTRPLLHVTIPDAYAPSVTPVKAPILSQQNCADFSYTPEQLIDALDAQLSRQEFLYDAFPYVSFDTFGPGVLSAFCGARLDNTSGGVWFFPESEQPIEDIHVHYNPDNLWVQRIKSIYRAGIERWGNSVTMGMPDLGGVLDVAATFRGTENLLTDLYDSPDEVLRLTKEVEIAWHEAYRDMSSVLQSVNMGYTDWTGLYSKTPSYVLQCDFCYMIGNAMFREFVLPTVKRDCDTLENTIYHLDGIGELPHLDDLLCLDNLNAIQWVYGDGKPSGTHWLDVYRRIAQSGKGIQIVGSVNDLIDVSRTIPDNLYYRGGISKDDQQALNALNQLMKNW